MTLLSSWLIGKEQQEVKALSETYETHCLALDRQKRVVKSKLYTQLRKPSTIALFFGIGCIRGLMSNQQEHSGTSWTTQIFRVISLMRLAS
ncbi:hypothetical protein [Flocculibacter collagenilyticus]|uniref:hypothetical protein n=1 Tax=Flocculibacter collagenilyticus TaxID=2744479 RepID=UPI0018F371B4|nr:hypothetical protein [Flocculibacter collagenilyticus]